RRRIGVLAGDLIVHVEEVAVFLFDHFDPMPANILLRRVLNATLAAFGLAIPFDRRCIIEIDSLPGRAYPIAGVATFLCRTRSDIARNQVAKSRIASFQVIVPFFGGDLARFARVVLLFGHPYSSVIAQRLRHERQLGLMFPRDRYTRRVYLRETGIAEPGAFFVGFPCGRDVAAHGIGRQVKDIAITAAAEEYGMTEISFELA